MAPRMTPDRSLEEPDGEPMRLLGDGHVTVSASCLQSGE